MKILTFLFAMFCLGCSSTKLAKPTNAFNSDIICPSGMTALCTIDGSRPNISSVPCTSIKNIQLSTNIKFLCSPFKPEPASYCNPSLHQEWSNGFNQYKCQPAASGPKGMKGRIVEDFDVEKELSEEEVHKNDLAIAVTTRILTAKELKEVIAYGPDLFTHPMEPFNQDDVDRKFQNALDIQYRLRLLATVKGKP